MSQIMQLGGREPELSFPSPRRESLMNATILGRVDAARSLPFTFCHFVGFL